MKTIHTLSFSMLLVYATSCYYDNGDYLYPNADASCDTLSVTFTPVVSTLIYQSCATTNCHVAGTGRVPLTNYQEIKAIVDNGLFAQRTLEAKDMPPQGPLNNCNLKKLNAWLKEGAPNN